MFEGACITISHVDTKDHKFRHVRRLDPIDELMLTIADCACFKSRATIEIEY
jgi:hypothetical protein